VRLKNLCPHDQFAQRSKVAMASDAALSHGQVRLTRAQSLGCTPEQGSRSLAAATPSAAKGGSDGGRRQAWKRWESVQRPQAVGQTALGVDFMQRPSSLPAFRRTGEGLRRPSSLELDAKAPVDDSTSRECRIQYTLASMCCVLSVDIMMLTSPIARSRDRSIDCLCMVTTRQKN
jgi:hypothetical protein